MSFEEWIKKTIVDVEGAAIGLHKQLRNAYDAGGAEKDGRIERLQKDFDSLYSDYNEHDRTIGKKVEEIANLEAQLKLSAPKAGKFRRAGVNGKTVYVDTGDGHKSEYYFATIDKAYEFAEQLNFACDADRKIKELEKLLELQIEQISLEVKIAGMDDWEKQMTVNEEKVVKLTSDLEQLRKCPTPTMHPASEPPKEDLHNVIVFVCGVPYIGWHSSIEGWSRKGIPYSDVTHWMERPELPKEQPKVDEDEAAYMKWDKAQGCPMTGAVSEMEIFKAGRKSKEIGREDND